jgi:hypothetical protein
MCHGERTFRQCAVVAIRPLNDALTAQGKKKRVSTSHDPDAPDEFKQINVDSKSPAGAAAAAAAAGAAAAAAGGVAAVGAEILAGQQRLEQLLSACLEAERSGSVPPADAMATAASASAPSVGSPATSAAGAAQSSGKLAAATAAAAMTDNVNGAEVGESEGLLARDLTRDLSSVSDLEFMRLVREQLSDSSVDSSMAELVDSVDVLNAALQQLAAALDNDKREHISKAAKRVIAKGSWARNTSVPCSVEILIAKLVVSHCS